MQNSHIINKIMSLTGRNFIQLNQRLQKELKCSGINLGLSRERYKKLWRKQVNPTLPRKLVSVISDLELCSSISNYCIWSSKNINRASQDIDRPLSAFLIVAKCVVHFIK
jgi:hypothetical protein